MDNSQRSAGFHFPARHGLIQLYCRNSQEVLDTVIQAFRIAERVLIPVMCATDGLCTFSRSTPVEEPLAKMWTGFCPLAQTAREFHRAHIESESLILSEPRQDADGNMRPGYMDIRYSFRKISSLS